MCKLVGRRYRRGVYCRERPLCACRCCHLCRSEPSARKHGRDHITHLVTVGERLSRRAASGPRSSAASIGETRRQSRRRALRRGPPLGSARVRCCCSSRRVPHSRRHPALQTCPLPTDCPWARSSTSIPACEAPGETKSGKSERRNSFTLKVPSGNALRGIRLTQHERGSFPWRSGF